MTYTKYGITYKKPEAHLLYASRLGIAEVAARTAYASYESSENEDIKTFGHLLSIDETDNTQFEKVKHGLLDIEESKLVDNLINVYFHGSIAEHISLQFYVKNTSRACLQELARHRIGVSLTVQSTRYTMSDILYAFLITDTFTEFNYLIKTYCNPFMVTDKALTIEISQLYDKLKFQTMELDEWELEDLILSKTNLETYKELYSNNIGYKKIFLALKEGKQKRNVGDAFKWIVTDNWSVDLMITFNLRSFMHFQKLRNSGSAYFQIRELSNALLDVTPEYIKKLIIKK